MTKGRSWIRWVDQWMRYLHLYTGLFLVPWMLVYAVSAFLLNHGPWINEKLGVTPPEWKVVRHVDFVPDDAFPTTREEQAAEILKRLDLDGAHRIVGKPNPNQMVIFRMRGSGHYRITWQRPKKQLLVEQQEPFSGWRLVHFLHFQCGYRQPYAVNLTWAVIVDSVAVSLVIWVISGVYLWLRMPRFRILGTVFFLLGIGLFAGLVVALCH